MADHLDHQHPSIRSCVWWHFTVLGYLHPFGISPAISSLEIHYVFCTHGWIPIFVSKPSAFVGSYTQDVDVSPFYSDQTYTIWWYNADSFRFCRSCIVPKNLKQCKESLILHTNARSVVSPCFRGKKNMFHAGPYVAADAGKSGGSRGPGNHGIFRQYPQIAGEWMVHVMNTYGPMDPVVPS